MCVWCDGTCAEVGGQLLTIGPLLLPRAPVLDSGYQRLAQALFSNLSHQFFASKEED